MGIVAKYITEDDFVFEVYSTMYIDWGLRIVSPKDEDDQRTELYYSPSSMSNESYGHKPNPKKYEDWDEAENASLNGDTNAFVPWNQRDWKECLESEADTFLEAYIPEETLNRFSVLS